MPENRRYVAQGQLSSWVEGWAPGTSVEFTGQVLASPPYCRAVRGWGMYRFPDGRKHALRPEELVQRTGSA